MFIHDFAHIARPYATVRTRLLDVDAAWMRAIAIGAIGEADDLQVGGGTRRSRRGAGRTVRFHPGTPYNRSDGVVVPLSWITPGSARLRASMEADLEAAPLGDEMTQVTLSGLYSPSPGLPGATANARVQQRLAEAAMRSFLTALCARLGRPDEAAAVPSISHTSRAAI